MNACPQDLINLRQNTYMNTECIPTPHVTHIFGLGDCFLSEEKILSVLISLVHQKENQHTFTVRVIAILLSYFNERKINQKQLNQYCS